MNPGIYSTGWFSPGNFGSWRQFVDKMVERRGVFYVRKRRGKRIVFIGRSRAFDLAETIGRHVGNQNITGRIVAVPCYKCRDVEVKADWCPGLGHAEGHYRRMILKHRPEDVPAFELAEAARIVRRVVKRREPREHHTPHKTNRDHRPAAASVTAEVDKLPGGLPPRLDGLGGRLTDDVAASTPPGAIVLLECLDHASGETYHRIGRLLENCRIASVFMFDNRRALRVSRDCLSVLIVGGAA